MQTPNQQMENMAGNMIRMCVDMNSMARGTMEAALQSLTIMTKGCEEMCDTLSSMMQNSLEQSAKAGQAMAGAKSMREIMDMQSNLMKSGFENMMSEVSKITQISARTAQQASEPVANQVSSTMAKAMRSGSKAA